MEEPTSQAGSIRNQLVGQRVGSYRVLDTLGSGGMSTVYRAVHVETGHEVALKVLLGTLSRSSTLLQRFLREARSAETLEHSNIVTIYDRGVDQGRHYLVLEYVAGGDFHEYVQRNGPLGASEAIAVIRGIASGLRYAAGRGLIHRDIKPSNILRTPKGEPKIIDLGLALQSEFEDERVTREGTTVGTVDYMAPEQARDSRATSIHSDMYSLGCTFYYLLAGIPPFPGGDITEKLTRHARAPAPDIRDLRPDIPVDVASILLRLMAKQPEDRFADYDQLIAALDAVARPGDDAGAIALAPLDAGESDGPPEIGPGPPARADLPSGALPDSELMLLGPLNGLSLDLADERDGGHRKSGGTAAESPLPRLGDASTLDESDELLESQHVEGELLLPPAGRPLLPWILATSALAVVAIALAIILHLTLEGPGAVTVPPVDIPNPDRDPNAFRGPRGPMTSPGAGSVSPGSRGGAILAKKEGPSSSRPAIAAKPPWVEPDDRDPIPGEPGPTPPEIRERRSRLPEWTRANGAMRPEETTVAVRRVADPADGLTVTSLNRALNEYTSGVVELADVGPLPVDDLNLAGESRVIRARRGYRPIIRILRSRLGPARDQSAFFLLKQKSLTLEGVDLIVDARDLSGKQTALFGCVGSNLTLRNCTVTVINPTGARFALVRQEAPARQERAPRPSRIWLDRTLIRGTAITVAELTGGPVDLVMDGAAILDGAVNVAGDPGPGPAVVRVSCPEGPDEQRIFLVGSLLGCPGPVIHCDQPEAATARLKPLVIRADGSAIGRLQGPGIASIVTSTDEKSPAERQVNWSGDFNLFAGWRGFFARGPSGPKMTMSVEGLARARSTWNATEQGSQWILLDWPLSSGPIRLAAADMAPFLPGRQSLMVGPARPSVGLYPKTLEVYPDPLIPDPPPWNVSTRGAPIAAPPHANLPISTAQGAPPPGTGVKPATAAVDASLVMNTADPRWAGDLGAFLRGSLSPGTRRVRVLVVGSGSHRFTPVRLPEGVTLEVHVEADPIDVGLPSWSPAPQATGPGLIEVRGGALVLSDVHLRHDSASRLDSLLSLNDSHLVLTRCQLTVPPDSGTPAGDLISFRAPTTRPMLDHPGNAAFPFPMDRPVCRMIETILIANRTALRAEIGRGLVALTRCAVASDETAIELDPARVARRSFEADLWLDHCTLLSARSIIGLGPWPGVRAGPDRPWLVNSRQSAFFTLSDAKNRDAALVRVDADAYAGGALLWQADGDAYDLDRVVAAGGAPVPSRPGENPWGQFWASHHATRTVTGPRASAPRFRRRPRPGRIEPADLILEPVLAGQRATLPVGADLSGLGGGQRPGPRVIRPE